ncbi:MAG: aminopeptidase, partial [Muricauda sp.]|nr:aminopeptidase [Allomuricauda sp.]
MRRCCLLFILVSLMSYGQNPARVDFTSATVSIHPDSIEKSIKGSVVYTFEVLHKTDSVYLDAIDTHFNKIMVNGKAAPYSYNGSKISVLAPAQLGTHKLKIDYEVRPKQTVYFLGWDDEIEGNEQIWTQGQGKYTSHWLPSFDDMTEKLEIDLSIVADMGLQVLANGSLKSLDTVNEYHRRWHYDMTNPMSSYLAAFVIGDFDKKTIKSNSGIPIELYYEPKDSTKVEPTYRYTKEIFDFLEAEIGVPYPWQNYKQVPVHDFLYAGMENTTLTIFSNTYVIDSTAFIDKNYVNVNAHELAHQWFGNLVTETSGKHHWLHEGFATYYAYLAEKE